MRSGIFVSVPAADRRRPETIVADRNTPQKHVWRVRIILRTAAGDADKRSGRRCRRIHLVVDAKENPG